MPFIEAAATAAKEIYEVAKTIKQVYDVAKETESVAVSEGKDQVLGAKNLGSSLASAAGKELTGTMETSGGEFNDSDIKGDFDESGSNEISETEDDFPGTERNLSGDESGLLETEDDFPETESNLRGGESKFVETEDDFPGGDFPEGDYVNGSAWDRIRNMSDVTVFDEEIPVNSSNESPFVFSDVPQDFENTAEQTDTGNDDFRRGFEENYRDNLPTLEEIDHNIDTGRVIPPEELRETHPDVAGYIDNLQHRLGNNEYAQSITAYETKDGDIILAGSDDRTNQLSNYAVVKGNDIYCRSGNAKGDGHLNEFINNTDGLIPDSRYHLENATYITDSSGRVSDVYEHHITERPTDRNELRPELKSVADAKDGRPDDIGGHIVAHNVDGATEAVNIVAMDDDFNNGGEWKNMESDILDAYQNGRECRVHKHLSYETDSRRPSHIDVEYEIEGERKERHFDLP